MGNCFVQRRQNRFGNLGPAPPWPLKQFLFQVAYLLSADRSINASLPAVQYNRLPAQPRIANMNKLQFKGSWNEIKGKLKQKYAQLTDDDLAYTEGKDEELVGKLQKKIGKSAEEVRQMLPTLTERRKSIISTKMRIS
jgi:uncharacterized protein YjbJ (UPF0337 family)